MKRLTHEEIPAVVMNLSKKISYMEMTLKEIIPEPQYTSTTVKDKCSSNFNKNDLAQFFYILMDEQILFFDIKEKLNRAKMQQFIQENFTYLGDAGLQTGIGTISKQFSESKGFTYAEKQLKFLDKIIEMLQRRREKIASK